MRGIEAQAPLLPHATATRQTSSKRSLALIVSLFALVALLAPGPFSLLSTSTSAVSVLSEKVFKSSSIESSCGQADPLMPPQDLYNVSSVRSFKDRIIQWHQGIVRIPTFVFDEMGEPGKDPKWEIFHELHAYLEKAYPLVHKHLKLHKVDTIGLVYEWIGSDTSLQPLMLAAHQDVVPVLPETLYQWHQPPFEGVYDGKYIWGRGSSDDKSGLTSIMAAIEILLETSDFKPKRSVILGFGHDEERGGQRGAPAIRDWLLENYGPDSMALLVDEGSGLMNNWGRKFAAPAVAEKGKLNLNMTLATLGGHSSIPPKHTNIGLTSLLIAALEKNPHEPIFKSSDPIWGYLQCASRYAPEIPKQLKKSVSKAQGSKKAFKDLPGEIIKYGLGTKQEGPGQGKMAEALITTTQATDIMRAGFKINALPEVSEVMINHRVNIHSSIDDIRAHVVETLQPVADELSLSISGWGSDFHPEGESRGTVYLSDAYEIPHGPAPITPTGLDNPAWRVFAGTSRGMWASRSEISEDGRVVDLAEDDELVIAPFMGTGNTDTRRYWDLTRNIYRFRYFPDDDSQGAHTVNEKVDADAMVEFTRYYQALILNVDASTEL